MSSDLLSVIESKLIPYVQKPMRYAGGEINILRKVPETVTVQGVLCFPDLYDIGMSHTGLQILYHIVNSHPSWTLSRCFHPWLDAEEIMRREGIPLYSLEYFTPVREADWIGFSVQYELHFTNIVNMLDLAGLAPLREERSEHDPLIIAGGPCVGNPEPLAPFIDLFVIGDGEEVLPQVITFIEQAKLSGDDRQVLLERLATLRGVYIPGMHEERREGHFVVPRTGKSGPTVAAKVPVLHDENYPGAPLVPLIEVVHRRLAVEVMRGCTRGCRFCSAGMYYRPVRERSPDSVRRQIEQGIASTGWDAVGLLSLSTADYSAFSELLVALQRVKQEYPVSCSLPSTRLDALKSGDLDQLERVSSVSSFTIAPEAGSERLRRAINKDFTDETIFDAVTTLMERNVQTLKLYFMIGLPTEQQEDIEAIVTLVSRIAGMVRAVSRRRQVNVAISPFSPKPHTPFEREAMDSVKVLLEKSVYIKQKLKAVKNVKVSYRNPEQTLLETIMARGDRSIGALVHAAWRRGARFDGWDECFNMARWKQCADELSLDLATFTDEIDRKVLLPWSAVTTGVSPAFLQRERGNALDAQPTEDCRNGNCTGCSVCDDDVKPVFSTSSVVPTPVANDSTPRAEVSERHRYRFSYRKSGLIRFLGHLDMVAVIHRACLMAKLPVAYSQGFNPHPRIAFGPPLPFGVCGEAEAFDMVTSGRITTDPLEVNRWLPEHITIHNFQEIPLSTASINSSVTAARYSFLFPPQVTRIELGDRLTVLLKRSACVIQREKKGRVIEKDIRSGILDANLVEGDQPHLTALLAMNGPTGCRPADLLTALGYASLAAVTSITRVKCHID